ncbi:MAG: 5-methyltetrahydropteroyltriglutamate--homocysteine S-methyltransferase [Betaproteobacteria bacterium]|nr:MAG: 5-methyltetrahydropteroyltriglutamate--homocysteine S-methyltransferase [Betaproteobacteria bacterium]
MRPPFRADQVGSLLRPERLKRSREESLGPQTPTSALGPHTSAELRAVEDDCIREVVAMQERIGLHAVTDGEFRRRSWWLELILGWEGFAADRTGSAKLKWRNEAGPTQGFSDLNVTGPIRWRPSSIVRAFQFLKANTRRVPKVTIPAPNCVHYYTGGKLGYYEDDRERFWADLVAAYRQELKALVEVGARYIQLDDTSIAFICDPQHRKYVRSWGEDPMRLLETYAQRINQTIAGLPPEVTITLHQCRGNREGNWAAEGGYQPVADVLFNRVNVNGYFLEYDTARAGGFEPLRLLPKGKRAVLGLVSTKSARVETAQELLRRIDEAAKFAPLESLALSPQCGFASSVKGNPLGHAEQEAKLAQIVAVAGKVWGNA